MLTPISTDAHSGVLGVLFPEEAKATPLIANLPATLDELARLARARSPKGYVNRLFHDGAAVFSAAWLLSASSEGVMVALDAAGAVAHDVLRLWRPYRLRAVHERGASTIITNSEGDRALVVPLPGRRIGHLAVLQLRRDALDQSQWAFVKAVAAQSLGAARKADIAATTDLQVAASHSSPRLIYFGPPSDLRERCSETVAQRGWTMECLRYFPELLRLNAERRPPNAIAVAQPDADACAVAVRVLRTLTPLRLAPLAAFCDRPSEDVRLATDYCRPTAAGSDEIFSVFKGLLRLDESARQNHLDGALEALGRTMGAARRPQHAAQLAVNWLGRLADLVYLNVFEEDGSQIAVQPDIGPQLRGAPQTLLRETTIQPLLGKDFVEALGDASFALAVQLLAPISGASLVLEFGGKAFGTVVCFNTEWQWERAEIQALLRYASVVSRALASRRGLERSAGVL